jgi:hypothetical protein
MAAQMPEYSSLMTLLKRQCHQGLLMLFSFPHKAVNSILLLPKYLSGSNQQ